MITADELLKKANWLAKKPAQRGVLSTGELIAVAMVMNKPMWLKETGLTLCQCLDRFEPSELSEIFRAGQRRWLGDY